MQPYQEATEEIKRQGQLPFETVKKAANIGASAATAYFGGSAVSRVLPFLSKYIPEELVKKGLNKIDPRYGKFIDKALSNGQSIEEVKDFIGEKIQENSKKEPAKENRNIIQQYSPELFQFLQDQIQKGNNPIAAGAAAQNNSKFSNIIKKISKDHKSDWSSILQTVFGNEQAQQTPQQQNTQQQGKQQAGQGQAALMAILQKLQQSRGAQ